MRKRLQLFTVRTAMRTLGRVAPERAARLAERLFTHPPRAAARPHEDEFLATGTPFALPISAGTLAAWRWGEGPTVLLVHGWASRAARFRVLVPRLVAAGFSAVAYDGPAHGRSPGQHTSLPEYAAALLEVAAQLGPLHAAVGHSLGGGAIAVALARGLALQRAVLIAPFAAPPEFFDQFADHVALPPKARERLRTNLERRYKLKYGDLYVPHLVREFTVPALVIHDRDDLDIPLRDGKAVAEAWPGATFVRTEGLGHHAIMRDAGVMDRVTGFIAEVR
ncbi:MAG: alpha/beta fold hydrolase [Gemmatimonadetes bacterium]|nr:alpha/beta fold hydrolase [Gemmatimonadota bacterium]